MDRVDTIIRELSSRHRNADDRFLAAVRPMVERILEPGTPADARVPLLEMLAETFERDARMREDFTNLRKGLRELFERLRRRLAER
jgi:hypothetical protein